VSSYDDKIRVNTVFGTGRIVTTDSPGKLIIQLIVSKIFFVYLTDMNGGGLTRKRSVHANTVGVTSSLKCLLMLSVNFH